MKALSRLLPAVAGSLLGAAALAAPAPAAGALSPTGSVTVAGAVGGEGIVAL